MSKSHNPDDLGALFGEIQSHLNSADQSTQLTFTIPPELMSILNHEANKRDLTITELMRKFFRFGLILCKAEENPAIQIIFREEGEEDKRIILS